MLTVNPLNNVNYTLNRTNISFGTGEKNYFDVPAPYDLVGNSFVNTVFGSLKGILSLKEIFIGTTVEQRTKSIQAGMDNMKLNYFA